MEYIGVIKIKFLIVIINTNSIIQVIRINKIIINKWDLARPFMSTFAVLFHVTQDCFLLNWESGTDCTVNSMTKLLKFNT